MSWFSMNEPQDDWIKALFLPAYDLVTMETDHTRKARADRERRKKEKAIAKERKLQEEILSASNSIGGDLFGTEEENPVL
ncbi:hypothetical protein SAMN04487866_11094 [Thermoactinomyces sp. DSM 45891]|uniref:hypothetical protein n=1 Tax=Thermoactinomyces sp. DSM 45891 TaxID=1761907 RepID=UPI000921EE0B|nr:hypothetical protein [Thermoactinomyces sp. DSM 45891]SFX52824.1 hypothetical protein SAMN04487866_11094 [Thermoactinomyces sp. DSM 45891]